MTSQVNVLTLADKNLMLRTWQTDVSGSQTSFMSFIALVPMLLMINIVRKSARLSCYFSVKIPLFFAIIVSLFGAGAAPFFDGSGSGSGSEQTVSAAPAPAPAPTKMCRLRQLRLRLRLRLRIPAFKVSHIFESILIPRIVIGSATQAIPNSGHKFGHTYLKTKTL